MQPVRSSRTPPGPRARARRLALLAPVAVTALLGGCTDGGPPPDDPCMDTATKVTYQGTIRPFLEARCVTCHRSGGIAPFSLESWSNVRTLAHELIHALDDGHMPPAQTDPACRVMDGQRYVSDAERALFHVWEDAGYPEGNACAYVAPVLPPEPEPLPAPSMELQVAEPLTLSTVEYDEYRVVYIDYVFPEDTYVLATEFVPDDPSLVHHASVLLNDPSGQAAAGGATPVIGGQLPGTSVFRAPAESAMWIPAGSQIFLDLHYHVPPLPEGSPAPTDQPRVRLWTLPAGETPALIAESIVRTVGGFTLAAGDADVVVQDTFPLPDGPSQVWGFVPHMHTRAVAFHAELVRADASRDCAIDVLNYHFHWQLVHRLPADGYLPIDTGDSVEITCFYDNSQANQPIVDGVQLPTSEVQEGPGSLDEMCQLQILRVRPFTAPTP